MARILLLDDDQNHLNAMWRAIWLDGKHEAERFGSANDALARAQAQDFDLAIVDYRMPEMDGMAFLHAFRGLQPLASRILITGNSDMALFRQAINEMKLHRLLEKPCDGFQLIRAVHEGLEQTCLARENARLRSELETLQAKYDALLAGAGEGLGKSP